MEQKPFHRRLLAICGLFAVCMAVFVASMFSAQIVHGEEYLAQSVRTNTRAETVEASRGMITDRNGKVLVSNRPIYTLDFDASLLDSEDLNDAIVRLFALLDENGVAYSDDLPLSRTTPFSYDGTPRLPITSSPKSGSTRAPSTKTGSRPIFPRSPCFWHCARNLTFPTPSTLCRRAR